MTANNAEADLWVRRFHPAPDAPVRLVCFPHAGGSASYFFPVSQALSPKLDVLAVQYPGRQDRRNEACVDDIHRLADTLVDIVEPWADRPLALFGHSMGASLAFEVAWRLEDRGTIPLALFASGRRAPSRVRDEKTHLLDDEGLIADVAKLGGTEAQLLGDPEIRRMVLPAIRSDYKAAETYRYRTGGPLAAPIHAHIGVSDPKVSVDEAEAWKEHTTSGFELTRHDGGHFYLQQRAPQVIASIRDVTTALTAVD